MQWHCPEKHAPRRAGNVAERYPVPVNKKRRKERQGNRRGDQDTIGNSGGYCQKSWLHRGFGSLIELSKSP